MADKPTKKQAQGQKRQRQKKGAEPDLNRACDGPQLSQNLPQERLSDAQLLDAFEQVNQLLRSGNDPDVIRANFLDLCLGIFPCDQAWLLSQANIQNAHWNLDFFRARDGQIDSQKTARDRLTPELAGFFQTAFTLEKPTSFSSGSQQTVPDSLVDKFGCRSILLLALTPAAGPACLLGLNQCTRPRIWHNEEIRLLNELGLRLGDGLGRLTALQELHDKERQLRIMFQNTFDAMPSALIGIDMQKLVTQWNHKAEKLFGIPARQALKQPLHKLLPDFPLDRELLEQAICSRVVTQQERLDWQQQNQPRQLEISIFPINGGETSGAVIRVDDVTDRLQREEVFIQQNKMLSVGNLAAGIAHEINNPLAGIMQNLQVMRNRLNTNLPKNIELAKDCDTSIENLHNYMIERGIHGILDSAISSGQRAADIIQNMLNFSRKDEDSFHLHDLGSLLDKTVDLAASSYNLQSKYDFRKIKIIRQYSSDLPPAHCNPVQIQQVFLNLLNNGAHAMAHRMHFWEKNHNTLPQSEQPRFILRLREKQHTILCEIEDNGCGMREDIAKRVFEPFYTTKKIGEGTGLGMSICYFIITKNHNGKMSVDTTPDVGSRFIIELPKQA